MSSLDYTVVYPFSVGILTSVRRHSVLTVLVVEVFEVLRSFYRGDLGGLSCSETVVELKLENRRSSHFVK